MTGMTIIRNYGTTKLLKDGIKDLRSDGEPIGWNYGKTELRRADVKASAFFAFYMIFVKKGG